MTAAPISMIAYLLFLTEMRLKPPPPTLQPSLASSCPLLAHENEFREKRGVAARGARIYCLLHFSLPDNKAKTSHFKKHRNSATNYPIANL